MANRYCRNCGHELTEDARFCSYCGKPDHRVAQVPTPEADVPVGPVPGGAGGSAPPGEDAKPRITIVQFLLGFFLLVGVLWLVFSPEDGGGSASGGSNAANTPLEKQEENAGEGKAANPPQEEQEPAAEPAPEPITLSGTGAQATDFFELERGLSVFEESHRAANDNFVVYLLDEQGNEVDLVANVLGATESSNAFQIEEAGRYIMDVDANGPWQITVRQPRPQDAPETRSFSGRGDTATSMFRLSGGLKRVSATHQGESNFVVYILDSTGEEVDLVANEIGNADVSSTLTVPEDSLYLFVVESDGPWTINIE